MTTAAPDVHYVVYADDGAVLAYSGTDAAECAATRRALAPTHAGALVGQCMMGRQRWMIVAYQHRMPDEAYIRRRREGGLLGLTWEPASG